MPRRAQTSGAVNAPATGPMITFRGSPIERATSSAYSRQPAEGSSHARSTATGSCPRSRSSGTTKCQSPRASAARRPPPPPPRSGRLTGRRQGRLWGKARPRGPGSVGLRTRYWLLDAAEADVRRRRARFGSAGRAAGGSGGRSGAHRCEPPLITRLGISGEHRSWAVSAAAQSTRGLLGTQQAPTCCAWGCRGWLTSRLSTPRRSRSRRGGRSRSVGTIRMAKCARTRRVRGCARGKVALPGVRHRVSTRLGVSHPRRDPARLPLLAPRTPTAPPRFCEPPSAHTVTVHPRARHAHDWMVFELSRPLWTGLLGDATTHQAPSPTSGASSSSPTR